MDVFSTLKLLYLFGIFCTSSHGGVQASRLLQCSTPESQNGREQPEAEEFAHVLVGVESESESGAADTSTMVPTQGSHGDPPVNPSRSQKLAERLLLTQMGSKPPNCDGKCSLCRPCVAVEVPISNHVVQRGNAESSASQEQAATVAPDDTNYLPESWRCSCGDIYYSP